MIRMLCHEKGMIIDRNARMSRDDQAGMMFNAFSSSLFVKEMFQS